MDTKTIKELLVAKIHTDMMGSDWYNENVHVVDWALAFHSNSDGESKFKVRFTMGKYPRIYTDMVMVCDKPNPKTIHNEVDTTDTKQIKALLVAKLNERNPTGMCMIKELHIHTAYTYVDDFGIWMCMVQYTLDNYQRIYTECVVVPSKEKKHHEVWTYNEDLEPVQVIHDELATTFEGTVRSLMWRGWKDENGYPLMIWVREPHETKGRYLWKGNEMFPSGADALLYIKRLRNLRNPTEDKTISLNTKTTAPSAAAALKCLNRTIKIEPIYLEGVNMKPIYANPLACPKCKTESYVPFDVDKYDGLALDGLQYIKKECGKTLCNCPKCGNIAGFTDEQIAEHKKTNGLLDALLDRFNNLEKLYRNKKVNTPVYGVDERKNIIKLTNGDGCSTFEQAVNKHWGYNYCELDVRNVRYCGFPVFKTAESAHKYLIEVNVRKVREYFNNTSYFLN